MAGHVASARSDLWVPGALGFLVYLGWLPLLVAVSPSPRAGDLAFLGVQLIAASAFPWNVVALVSALVVLALVLVALAATAEAVLVSGLEKPPERANAASALTVFGVMLVLGLPVAAGLLTLALGIATVAPGLFLETPSLVVIVGRMVAMLWPFLALLGALLVLAQALGAGAIRSAVRGAGLAASLSTAGGDLLRNPVRRVATAALGLLGDGVAVVISTALLRVLWAPIGADLAAGSFLTPATLALLLGFVVIWLALVLTTGALRTWLSAWWTLEIRAAPRGGAVHAS